MTASTLNPFSQSVHWTKFIHGACIYLRPATAPTSNCSNSCDLSYWVVPGVPISRLLCTPSLRVKNFVSCLPFNQPQALIHQVPSVHKYPSSGEFLGLGRVLVTKHPVWHHETSLSLFFSRKPSRQFGDLQHGVCQLGHTNICGHLSTPLGIVWHHQYLLAARTAALL